MGEKSYRVSSNMSRALVGRLMTEREAESWAEKHIADWRSVGRDVTVEVYYQGVGTPCKVFRDGVVLGMFEEADRTRQKRLHALRKLGLRPTVAEHLLNENPANIGRLAQVKGVGAKTIERSGEGILAVLRTRWCDL